MYTYIYISRKVYYIVSHDFMIQYNITSSSSSFGAPSPKGHLGGLTFAAKDNIDVAGLTALEQLYLHI